MEKTDEQLMLDYQYGDKQAMETIFHRYKVKILNFCWRLLENRTDAEEASSEVFLKLFQCEYEPSSTAKFSTWLYTVARNQCISHIRKRGQVFSVQGSSNKADGDYINQEFQIEDTGNSASEELLQKEKETHVRLAIQKLPQEQKEAIILRQYHDLSYQEISLILNCSMDNVKVLIFRAKQRLRVELLSFLKEDAR